MTNNDPANDQAVQLDWLSARGRVVVIRHENLPIRSGLVEDVTVDGSILWLASNGVNTRTMIEKSEGYMICDANP
jgi:hypothetical protein